MTEVESAEPMHGDEAFIAEHMDLVRRNAVAIAAEYRVEADIADLVGWGIEGLLTARRRFDPTRGVSFDVYAHYRVRGAVLDGVRQLADLPRQAVQVCRRAAQNDAYLEDAAAIAGEQEPPFAEDGLMLARALDALLSELTVATVAAASADPERGTTPEEVVLSDLERRRVRKAVSTMPPREARVVSGVYFEDLPLDDLGRELNLSRSQVSRIHTRGLQMLREALG